MRNQDAIVTPGTIAAGVQVNDEAAKELCCVCDRAATVIDTEYEEFYCDKHAEEYQVLDGPHDTLKDRNVG